MTSPPPARRMLLSVAILAFALLAAPAAAAPATWTNVTWSTTFSQQYGVSEAQGLALGGKLYSFGGFDSAKSCCTPTSRAYRMDPATGWTALAAMPAQNGTTFGGVTHAGLTTDGTYIYWAGGYTSNAAGNGQIFGTKEVWRYDPEANAYSRMPDLPLARAGGQLAYLDGKLHYFGGTNLARTEDVGEQWALDLSSQAAGWVARAPLPNPRHHLGAAVLGAKIYAIGGQRAHDAQLITQNDVHAYDPVTNSWTQRADLPRAIGHISSSTFAMDGRIVVLGGEIAHNSVIADASAYNPDANAWTALTPLPAPRRSGVADVIAGVIYYSTGQSNSTYRGVPAGAPPAWPKRYNHQPASAPVPAGYSVDSGLGFDAGRGFGWVREDSLDGATHTALDISPNARDRNLLGDQRVDTLLHMQFPASASSSTAVRTPAAWECVLPNGTYDVTVSVGDAAANFDSTHRINLEGALALGPFTPTSANRFASATKRVAVNDGRLTLDAKGGTNTKINYVEIAQSTMPADTVAPDAPGSLTATAGDARVSLSWAASAASDVAGYRVYRSTSMPVPISNPISGSSLVSGTSFTDTTAQNAVAYHYVVVAVDTSANASGSSPTATATPRAAALDLRVNFQPDTAAIPAGYVKDGGLPYSAARGFGWVREDSLSTTTHAGLDVAVNARDRNLVTDQRIDTLIHMQYPAASSGTAVRTPAAWEAAVADGTYEVTVGVGDAAANFDSTHRIRLEGTTAIAGFVPMSANRFAQATQTVTVADGRLTVDALGGTNTKIDFVTIKG